MKLRTILKLISFVLMIFSTMIVLRYPVYYLLADGNSGGTFGLLSDIFGSTEIKLVELFLYLLFAFHMHMLDFKFPKAEFGKYFRYDMFVSALNYYIITQEYSNITLGFMAKITIEIAACVTTFFCGWSLCKTLKNHGMTRVGISYLLLSSRHVVYFIILLVQLCIVMFGNSRDPEQFSTATWTVVQWFALMPLLFISRFLLFRGTMGLKVHKHTNREI